MHTLLDARIARSLTLVVTSLVIILVLVWQVPPSAPAAASEGIQTVFLGSLTGSATTDPGPADALFTTLAAQATTSIDVMLYDFDRAGVRDALLAAHNRGVTVRVVGDNEAAENPDDKPFYESLTAAGIPVVLDDRSSLQHNKVAVFDDAVT
jgi:phosphatidylserine/phosphatidylglycerophosphate/cardiolipin synthase-like enzyme